jgi:hypothetical protein
MGTPVIIATPDRVPDGGGWYRGPVSWMFTCSEARSGVAACSIGSGPEIPTIADQYAPLVPTPEYETLLVPRQWQEIEIAPGRYWVVSGGGGRSCSSQRVRKG